MKISNLKQPYRRMAEYLEDKKIVQISSYGIYNFFTRGGVMDLFCNSVDKGSHPEITEEIKRHFPSDFDFSGEDGKNVNHNFRYISNTMLLDDILPLVFNKIGSLNSSEFNEWFNSDFLRFLFDKKHFIDKNNNELYTQLAKNGRFDELPDTCEFLEAVELEVWDNELSRDFRKIIGKFKGNYMDIHCIGWKFAQLPTKKIDFTQFKAGDVVEVEEENLFYGQLCGMDDYLIFITFGICENAELTKCIEKEKIKSITKIK